MGKSVKALSYREFAEGEERKTRQLKLTKGNHGDIESIIKEEFGSLKIFIHNEIRNLHIDMIRQMQQQEFSIKDMFNKSFEYYNTLHKEKLLLEKENAKLKENYF